jgi:simple sugar transport system permease protein
MPHEPAEPQTDAASAPLLAMRLLRLFSPLLVPMLAILTALIIGAVIIWLTGEDWVAAYVGLWEGSFGSWGALENTIVRATPYIIAGLAVALGFQAGLFNIGAEGQLYAGATLAVLVGFSFPGLPPLLHIPLAIAAGAVGGLIWGAIPGLLKARTGAHEVINTIMLNYIAIRLTDWLIRSREPLLLGDPADTSGARTRSIAASAELPAIPGTALHGGILLAGVLVLLVYWLLYHTTIGFELRTVGANPAAARYAGMNVSRNIVLAMALSGMLAGLAGSGEVLGVEQALTIEFFSGLGFDSIAVALLARSHPIGIIFSGLLWGGLLSGANLMQVRAGLSSDMIKIIQALIIMFVAADQIIRWLYRVRAHDSEGQTIFSRGWGA